MIYIYTRYDRNRVIPPHGRVIRDDVACAKYLLVVDTSLSENLHEHEKPNTNTWVARLISYIILIEKKRKTYDGIVVSISSSEIDDTANVGHRVHQDVGRKPTQIIQKPIIFVY